MFLDLTIFNSFLNFMIFISGGTDSSTGRECEGGEGEKGDEVDI